MNAYEWMTEPVAGGFLAKFRRVDRSRFETICEDGKPRVFPEKVTAENAAMSLLLSFVNIDIRCWRAGGKAGRREAAEKLFPKLVKQRGKTRAVEVVRR